MEQLTDFATHLALGIAGLLIFSLIAVRHNLKRFSLKIFVKDNKPFWIWALLLQVIFAVLVVMVPASAEAIKTLTGVDLSEPMAFLTSGAALGGAALDGALHGNRLCRRPVFRRREI